MKHDAVAAALPQATGRRAVIAERIVWGVEQLAAAIVLAEIVLLLMAVLSRYVFHYPLVWVDELASAAFLWLVMLGSAIALWRGEHMRLSTVTSRLPAAARAVCQSLAVVVPLLFLVALAAPAVEYASHERDITMPALGISNVWRAAAIAVGIALMLGVALLQVALKADIKHSLLAAAIVLAVCGLLWLAQPLILAMGNYNLFVFFGVLVIACVTAGVPIGFTFGVATLGYLVLTTEIPLTVVVSRIDEGVSNVILLAVPGFVVLGLLLGISGMARAMMGFLFVLLGNVRGGLSYVLLAAIYVVSGISGSKAADMAAVAPVLFPEMKKRGIPDGEMASLLGASTAMSETIPPSLVLIAIGSVTGVSIASLFAGGLLPALVLALGLAVLCGVRSRRYDKLEQRTPFAWKELGRTFVYGLPALGLPFLMRFTIVEGIATATEVSTVAIVYVLLVGTLVYRQFDWRKVKPIFVETASLSGAVLFIIGTATAMGWALTQSGFSRDLAKAMGALPGGAPMFLAASIAAFIVLGSLLEGIPAVVLFGPMLFPAARALGIHEVHYAMVAVLAMGIGLFSPPFGIGFYSACAIGKVDPSDAMKCVWPYMATLVAGLAVVAAFPWLTTAFL